MVTELMNIRIRTSLIVVMILSLSICATVILWDVLGSKNILLPLWVKWIVLLFLFTLVIGIVGPLSGVGGGVIFVGLGMAVLPFHVDSIRGAGLVAALTTSLNSAPYFTRKGLANMRIVAPLVVVSTIFSILDSIIGLWVSNAFPDGSYYVKIGLGVVLLLMLVALATSKNVEYPEVRKNDKLADMLGIKGMWYEPTLKKVVEYRATNLPIAMMAFAGVGFIAGMFGLGVAGLEFRL